MINLFGLSMEEPLETGKPVQGFSVEVSFIEERKKKDIGSRTFGPPLVKGLKTNRKILVPSSTEYKFPVTVTPKNQRFSKG